jgi:SM-20-related protein
VSFARSETSVITVRILLSGGHFYETRCARDSALLRSLSAILALGPGASHVPSVLQFDSTENGKVRGVAIPSSAIVAVETQPKVDFSPLDIGPEPAVVERAPYIRIPAFLSFKENQRLFDYVKSRESDFNQSSVDGDVIDYRRSRVLYRLDDLGVDFETRIREITPEVLQHFSVNIPPALSYETQLTASNDGDFFKTHNDNGSATGSNRILTYVYYFQREPVAYNGGQLRLYDSLWKDNQWIAAETFHNLAPENNLLVMFPSRITDGRFTLNGWVRDATKPVGT